MLVAHRFIFHEGRELRIGHADGLKQERVSGYMHGLNVGEGRQHHFDFGRLKDAGVTLHIIVVHFHIGLGEEAENLGQQIALIVVQTGRPVFAIFAQRHFFRQPMNLLLALPELIGPRITEWLVTMRWCDQPDARTIITKCH